MPKKPKQPVLEVENPNPEKPKLVPLDYEARKSLTAILNTPVFVQAWRNAMLAMPSLILTGLDTPMGPQVAYGRLHQLQGWEFFKAALLRQTDDPPAGRPRMDETYPDPPPSAPAK